MFTWLKKWFAPAHNPLGVTPHPVILNPTETQKILRVKARIERLEQYLPQLKTIKKAPYEAELQRLKDSLKASGIE